MNLEFLKEILGEELFNQFIEKLNAHNGNDANKDKQIKLVNLTDGGYVSKDKYTDLETSLTGKTTELETANNLIADLKKNAGKDSELQGKITAYETQIADLQAENAKLKAENALKFALIEAGATDVDYVFYKATEKLKADGKTLELDESEKVKGVDDLITGLKTQLPGQFNSASGGDGGEGHKVVKPNNLPGGNGEQTITAEQFRNMGYQERLNLKKSNPEQFAKLSKR